MFLHSLARRGGDVSISKCLVEVVVCQHLIHPILRLGKLRSLLLWREERRMFKTHEPSPLGDGQRVVIPGLSCAAARVKIYHKPC